MLAKRLVRNYYEKNGSFKNIEKQFFYNDFKELIGNNNVTNELYKCIGFKDTPELSAEMAYKYRQLYVTRKFARLYKLLNVNTMEALVDALKSMNCVGIIEEPVKEISNLDLVKLIAEYYRTDTTVTFDTNTCRISFSDLISGASLIDKMSQLKQYVNSKVFRLAIKSLINNWECVPGCQPTIELGVVYTPQPLTVKERNEIKRNAVYEAAFNSSRISLNSRLKVLNLVTSDIVNLYDFAPDNYRALIDISLSLGLTIRELFELCDLNYIDTESQVLDTGASVTLVDRNKVKLYVNDSRTLKDFVILDLVTFKEFYEQDIIRTIRFNEAGYAEIKLGFKYEPLGLKFMGTNTNEIIRG